jgi:hypothetical protein
MGRFLEKRPCRGRRLVVVTPEIQRPEKASLGVFSKDSGNERAHSPGFDIVNLLDD